MYPNTLLSSVFPSTTSVFSMYTGFIATAMVLRTVINKFQSLMIQLIPHIILDKISSKLRAWFCSPNSSVTTLVIDEFTNGFSPNEIYEASQLYLQDKISPFSEKLKVMKSPRDKNISVTVNKGEEIVDLFQGIKLTWSMITAPPNNTQIITTSDSFDNGRSKLFENRSMEITFPKNQRETIITSYLPHVLKCAKSIKERNTGIKLYSTGHYGGDSEGIWGSINLDHPSTFDTLAMDPTVKKALIDDLDRFVSRREYYRRVGKAWKRGYLLYGPPGTGKSSLIAAMSNYLKFNVYDLELRFDRNFRQLLVSTANRSIIVIEDIDCGIEMKNRHEYGNEDDDPDQLTLSGLLNFVDGLWSSCGDERIIVFTTNRKDKLDPALLRPGRMDMHIHMSYLTPTAFEILARNYLEETNHRLFPRVKELLAQVEVTPAEVAEELMKSDDVDRVVENLIEFLESKQPMVNEGDSKSGNVNLDAMKLKHDDESGKS